MTDTSTIEHNLINAGHDKDLVQRTHETAGQLSRLLADVESPPEDSLKAVFEDYSDQ